MPKQCFLFEENWRLLPGLTASFSAKWMNFSSNKNLSPVMVKAVNSLWNIFSFDQQPLINGTFVIPISRIPKNLDFIPVGVSPAFNTRFFCVDLIDMLWRITIALRISLSIKKRKISKLRYILAVSILELTVQFALYIWKVYCVIWISSTY